MSELALEELQRLYDLKERKILTEAEYEFAKAKILRESFLREPSSIEIEKNTLKPRLGQGISLLVGSLFLFCICLVLVPEGDIPASQDLINEAVGIVLIFGAWIVPHSIYLLSQRGSNVVFPTISLSFFGLSVLTCIGMSIP